MPFFDCLGGSPAGILKGMGTPPESDPEPGRAELERIAAGNPAEWRAVVARHHARLRRMVRLRLDPRLQGRVDPSDVLQDAYLEASRRLPELPPRPGDAVLPVAAPAGRRAASASCTATTWGTKMRDAGREVSLYRGALPAASSAALAAQLLGRECRPSEAAVRAELRAPLQEALDRHGPARPRGAGPAPLRATDQRRDGPCTRRSARRRRASASSAPWSGSRRSWPGCPAGWEGIAAMNRAPRNADLDPIDVAGRGVPGPLPARRAAGADRVHRPAPGLGRPHPRTVPGPGR